MRKRAISILHWEPSFVFIISKVRPRVPVSVDGNPHPFAHLCLSYRFSATQIPSHLETPAWYTLKSPHLQRLLALSGDPSAVVRHHLAESTQNNCGRSLI